MRTRPDHYYRWMNIKTRIYNKKCKHWNRYGGRGIDLCKEWHTFSVFQEWCLTTYALGKSLDRIDNNKGYSPDNCRWSTQKEQMNNIEVTSVLLEQAQKARAVNKIRNKEKYGDPCTRRGLVCSSCKKYLLNKNFYTKVKTSRNPSGRSTTCIYCSRKYARERIVWRINQKQFSEKK
jgi:hypothetical protein